MPGTFGRAAVWDGARQPGCGRARGSLRLARVAELVANRDHAVEAADVGQGPGLTPAVAAIIDTLATAVRHDLDSLRPHSV